MDNAPGRVSYLALLLVLRERIHLERGLPEERYYIELAQELIQLYWEHDGGHEEFDWRQAA